MPTLFSTDVCALRQGCLSLSTVGDNCAKDNLVGKLLQTPSWFQGGRFAAGGEWRERLGGREGKGGMGKGGEKGEVGGERLGCWGDRRPCSLSTSSYYYTVLY